jgi:hypothetical protein
VSRYAVLAGVALIASCATASDGQQMPIDAHRPDTPTPVDAAVDMCPSGLTCQTSTVLGTVSGDTGADTLTAMGYQSAWFQVRVTEDYNDPISGRSLRLSAKLTSPSMVDFDVFVYLNFGNDVVECSTSVGTTTKNGTIDETRVQWGEGSTPNGNNDSRTASIEIRPISGACATAQMWQLTVQGNWN